MNQKYKYCGMWWPSRGWNTDAVDKDGVLDLFSQNYFLPPINKLGAHRTQIQVMASLHLSPQRRMFIWLAAFKFHLKLQSIAIFSCLLSAKRFVKSALCQCWEHRVKSGCVFLYLAGTGLAGRMLRVRERYPRWRGRVFKGLWAFLSGNELLRTLTVSSLLHWVATGILSEAEGLEGSMFSVLFYSAPFTGAVGLIVEMCTGVFGSTVISGNDKFFIGYLFVSCLNNCTLLASEC